MRKGFKPYGKRKIYKRESGGGKFMLGGGRGKDVSFDTSMLDKNVLSGMTNLISSILRRSKQR